MTKSRCCKSRNGQGNEPEIRTQECIIDAVKRIEECHHR